MNSRILIPIEISNRHVHLSRKDVDILFGKGHKLKIARKLSQPGQFAAEEKVALEKKGNRIENVRVIGPERKQTQVEILKSDAEKLKIDAPVRDSGDLKNTPGIAIVGPKGKIDIKTGVIVAQRHLHASVEDAKAFGLKDKQEVSIRVSGMAFENVLVRVGKNFRLAVHLDAEEGNAAGIKNHAHGELKK